LNRLIEARVGTLRRILHELPCRLLAEDSKVYDELLRARNQKTDRMEIEKEHDWDIIDWYHSIIDVRIYTYEYIILIIIILYYIYTQRMLYPGVNKVAVRLLQFNIIYPNISSPPSSNLVLKGLGIGISIACVAPRLVDQARPCLADQARNLSWLGRAKGQLDMERTTKKNMAFNWIHHETKW
jgi:hypothetical protein